jgi:hypothetical protein
MKPMGPLPAEFAEQSGMLTIAGTRAEDWATATPAFVYDVGIIAARVERFRAAFPGIDLHYAIKANPLPALLTQIATAVRAGLPDGGTVCDLFSGSARVGHALKREGFQVWSNDHNAYAHTLATAYVQAVSEFHPAAIAICTDIAERDAGRVKVFETDDVDDAKEWLVDEDDD